MKFKHFFVLIALCFCLFSCGDEGILIDDLVLSAPSAESLVVGPVPEDIQDIIWGKDVETLMAELDAALDDGGDIGAKHLIHDLCYRQAREAYYTKYINAGGVVIMGNRYIGDRFFYAARDIVLGMTQKRPELRKMLTPSREYRPEATRHDGIHDVTRRTIPSRKFRMILVHDDMSFTSIPEIQYGRGKVQYSVEPRAGGTAGSNFAWAYVDQFGEDIVIYIRFSHEFAHAIHFAIRLLDPTFDDRLQAAYASAKENGSYFSGNLYRGMMEYWAFSATYWFHEMASSEFKHDKFRKSDPLMYALLDEWFDLIHLGDVESRVYE